jgi:uncharacterized protein YbjT (DUF2867 family)
MRLAVAGGTGTVGRYVVETARASGHDVVLLTRSAAVDVLSGAGLMEALAGVTAVIDTLNPHARRRSQVEDFFTATSRRLQEAGAGAGVQHLVTLSILGIDRASAYGYYQAKVAQEAAVNAGPVPVTVLRASQFFEFPAQLVSRVRRGRVALVPRMRSQPVAARTVAEHLVRLAEQQPGGRVELAGPEVHDVADLARRVVAARGVRLRVVPVRLPGRVGAEMRSDAMLATATTELAGPTFAEWLASADAAAVPL